MSLAQARAEAGATSDRLVKSDKRRYSRLDLYVAPEMVVRRMEGYRPALLLFLGAAACVLLSGAPTSPH